MRRVGIITDKWRKKLEELMLAFMNGEFDVLVATIIEIRLDVPNASRFFINNIIIAVVDLHRCGDVWVEIKKHFVISSARPILP
jgi:transcription-repair coupling factor (superfamily II helicase)